MQKVFPLLIILIIIFSILSPCYDAGEIDWTEDAVDFINKHPVKKLGVDSGLVPFESIDIDSEYKGIAADYISLISEKTGIQFEVVKGFYFLVFFCGCCYGSFILLDNPLEKRNTKKGAYSN